MTPQKPVFHHLSPTGILEIYDLESGSLLEIREPSTPGTTSTVKESLVEYPLPDGRIILASHSIPLETIEHYYGVSGGYNRSVGDILCQKIVEGMSLTKACQEPGMPSYAMLCRWKRQNSDFAKQLVEAKQDRAEMLRDQVLDIADTVDEDSDAVAKARLRAESRKWAAGADAPQVYSGKAQIDKGGPGAVTIVISTGIDREPRDVSPLVEVKE